MGNVVPLPKSVRLECSSCGAEGTGSCDCGAPYVSARERAAKAIAANPEKSNRALAAELGIAPNTVRTARKSTEQDCPVDTRVGLDGKVRHLPKPKVVRGDEIPSEEECEKEHQQTLYDHACWFVDERMTSETRQKFFAYLKRKYHGEI